MEVEFSGYSGKCGCGKEHKIATKRIIIESGATKRFGETAAFVGLDSGGFVVCDSNTKTYADEFAKSFPSILHADQPVMTLDSENLYANEKAAADLKNAMPEDVAFMVAVGAGTVHDIVRYIAHERRIPFISYPTACCVDAFASNISNITRNRFKQTVHCSGPVAIIADTDVFSAAPYRLTAAGISDVLSKYTSLADWKCANLLVGEEFCDKVYGMVEQAIISVRTNLPAIHAHEPDAYEILMLALINLGLAMQMWGDSRPTSGSEYHLSCFWDMHILNGQLNALHGEQLGVGLLITLRYYEKIQALYGIERNIKPYDGMPLANMRKKLGTLYEGILKVNQPDILRTVSQDTLIEKIPEIKQLIFELPKVRTLRPVMKAAGCLTTCEEIGLDRDILPDCIELAPFSRRRLTIMHVSKLLPMK